MKTPLVYSCFSKSHPEVLRKLASIAKSGNIRYQTFKDLSDLQKEMRRLGGSHRFLLFLDEALLKSVSSFRREMASHELEIALFLTSSLEDLSTYLTKSSPVQYLIGYDPEESYGRELAILIKKFREKDILNGDKYLSFGADIQNLSIKNSTQRRDVIQTIYDFVMGLGGSETSKKYYEYARKVAEISDELLINAIFNANPKMKNSDRSRDFELDSGEEVSISFGYDGEIFGVSVRDPFGQLSLETMLQYLVSQKSVGSILSSRSAGLGLKLILGKSHHLIANIESTKITEIISLVKFYSCNREFESKKKSLYYFYN